MWQDVVIGLGQVVFVMALGPALFGKEKPPRSTCAITAVTLLATAAALLSLGLMYAGGWMIVTAICWTVLLLQRRTR